MNAQNSNDKSSLSVYCDLDETPVSSQHQNLQQQQQQQHQNKRTTNPSTMYYALRTPPTYRIGNRSFRFNFHFALLLAGVCALIFLFFFVRTNSSSSSDNAFAQNIATTINLHSSSSSSSSSSSRNVANVDPPLQTDAVVNQKYPLTAPVVARRSGTVTYRIAMVADLDDKSKVEDTQSSTLWRSYFKKGHLIYVPAKSEIIIKWDREEPTTLDSSYALKNRGMELSELVTFDGKLLALDDRTGLIYELDKERPIPWVILPDGDGHNAKGFKAEWATVKNNVLYVGSMGKEWTTATGEFENENPMYVKTVLPTGEVRSHNWSSNYKKLRKASENIKWPGYMIHESAVWSAQHKKWYFLPRRCSNEKYNETRDEYMGCNVLIAADERFNNIETVNLEQPNTEPTHGFSSFKFIPGTDDRVIVALKTEELNGKTATFITAFDINGKTLLPEQQVETDFKYEGLEFI